MANTREPLTDDLRKWFGTGKTGGVGGGGWDRYNTKGERIGKCGDAEDRGGEGEGKPKCLSKEKAAQLRAQGGKKAIANAVKRKKAQDPVTDRKGTGNTPRPVSNRIGESMLAEKNVPTNPSLWSRAKSEAKKRFDVYPSAYANGWAAKWYKERGGKWKSEKNEAYDLSDPSQREDGADSSVAIFKSMTPGEMDESSHTVLDTPTLESRQMMREFTQGKHVVLLAVPKNPNDGDGKGYWKVGTEVYRGPVKNPSFDAAGAPMDKRWESSFSHFARYFDSVYGQHYKKAPTWKANLKEGLDDLIGIIFETLAEASEYQGRKVTLGKPFRTPDGPKKFSVYVRNDKGNVVKVNFGDPNMEIKRDDPERRKNFRARHNCDNPGPRWKARYWSCRWGWGSKKLSA